ncbi:MAG: hypothetical protein RL538_306 [Candidatus Parcubacteria bacterium]|jgi:O-antigen/teichoic acid export membrane protein
MYNYLADFLHKKFHIDAHYFLKGGFWLSVTQGIVVLSGLISTALFAHHLSENTYGVYRYLIGLAAILASFSLTGIGESILQTAAKKYYNFYQETLKINFLYSCGISIAGIIGAIYYWINSNEVLALGCLLIATFQPFINTLQFIPAYLQGDHRYKEATINQLIKTLIVTIASIIVLFQTNNVLLLFATYLMTQTLANLVSYTIYKKNQTSIRTPDEVKNSYIKYAKHTSFRNAISLIANRLDAVVIFSSLGAASLAVYTIAIIVPEQIKGSLKNLMALLVPKYSRSETNFNSRYIKKRSVQIFLLLSFVTGVYILIAPYIYSVIFPKYAESILYSQIFALSIPSFVFYIPYSILKVKLDEKALYRITFTSSVTQISLLLVMTTLFGIIGTIISNVIYRYILAGIVYYNYYKSL